MIHLVVFAGQSNAEGFRMTAETLPAKAADHDDGKTFIWGGAYGRQEWLPFKAGENSGDLDNPQAWGPELTFAQDFRKSHPDDTLLIIKQASGSTGLAQDAAAADWSPQSSRELFHFMSRTIDKAQKGFTAWTGQAAPKVSALFWMQGEEDALSAAKAAAYQGNLSAFLAKARAQWMDDPHGKVMAGRIGDSVLLPHAADVRLGQLRVDQADPDFATFNTLGYAMQPDGIHYGAGGYVEMGHAAHRLWDEWF